MMLEAFSEFHFLRPLWLLAILPAALLIAFITRQFRQGAQWTQIIHPDLLPYLIEGQLSRRQRLPLIGLALAWVASCIALAGPTWNKEVVPVARDSGAMVILWDMSPSMLAQDLRPSRLVRSRLKLIDLLNARREGLTALVAYAGDAHVVTPLTDDTRTIKSLLPGIEPSILPEPGSNPERALEIAIELLRDGGALKGDIVFVTDGIARDALPVLQGLAAANPYDVTVWGFGTADGAPIPLKEGGFARDRNGNIVVAGLDHERLSDAAIQMNGVYIPFTSSNRDVENIQYFGLESSLQDSNRQTEIAEWQDQGYWMIFLLLPLVAAGFRRGWVVCFALIFFVPEESRAVEWESLWYNKDQRGFNQLQAEEAGDAALTFNDPEWRGIAKYRAGDFSGATESFDTALPEENTPVAIAPRTLYNQGNALTFAGRYDDAIAAYDRALKLQPDFPDAEHNRDIAEQLKQLQEQQNEEQSQDDSNSENSDQAQNQSKGEGESQQNQSGENQENSDGESSKDSESQSAESEQQNASDQADSNSAEQPSESQANETQSDKSMEESLEQHFGQNTDAEQPNQPQEAQSQAAEKSDAENDQQAQAAAMLSPEAREQQQALEQWLRKVPDDPTGLLRNKFQYEHQRRQREIRRDRARMLDQQEEERW